MPFQSMPEDVASLRLPMGEAEQPLRRIAPEADEGTLGPAFREGNWIASMIAASDATAYKPTPNYSPLEDIAETRYFTDFSDEFIGSRSSDETKSIIARIDGREKDKEILSRGGWYGTISGLAAGIVDPVNLIPIGGVAYRGGKMAVGLKNTASMAGMFAGTAAVQQGLLRMSHPEMTAEETIFNIGAATVMGGVFGAGASAFTSAIERKAAATAFEDMVQKPYREGRMTPSGGASIGAAAADTRVLEPVDMGLAGRVVGATLDAIRKVPVLGKPVAAVLDAPAALVRNIGPTNRVAYGEFVTAKRAMFDLADSPGILFKENVEGLPTVQGGGPTIETHARMATLSARHHVQDELNRLWNGYYWGDEAKRFGQAKAKVAQMMGKQEQGLLTLEAFKVEVSKAMRRKDEHAIPAVAESARVIRRDVVEPWKKMAIETKLLPEDVKVDETAASYLMRVWDNERIVAERPEVEAVFAEWLSKTQAHNATLKGSLENNLEARKIKERELRKLEARVASVQRRVDTTEQRLSERSMEAQASEQRFDTVEARQSELRQSMDELTQFIDDLKQSGNAPEIMQQVRELEKEVKSLESGLKSITMDDLEAVDKAVRKGVLVGPMRKVARIMTGKARLPKGAEPFWKYIARTGGVKDDGGDLRSMIGETITSQSGKVLGSRVTDKSLKRLFRDGGAQWDDLQSRLGNDFPELQDWTNSGDGLAEDFSDDIRKAIADSYNGKEPDWYVRERVSEDDAFVSSVVSELQDMQNEGLAPVFKSTDEFSDFTAGRSSGVTEADYDAMIASLDDGSGNMDARVAAVDVQNMADVRRDTVSVLKNSLETAKRNRAQLKTKDKVAGGRVDESAVAAGRNMRRADVLDRRSTLAQTQQEVLEVARLNAEKEIAALRLEAEKHLTAWKGKSSSEAVAAVAAREEAERVRGLKQEAGVYNGKGNRLSGADDAVDSAMRRIIASDRNMSELELKELSSEIVQRILSTPDGRLSYDAPSGGPKVGPPKDGPPPRGPMAHRSFMIPDELIERWLVNDVERVMNSYVNTMVPDTLIAKRFGTTDMEAAFKDLRDEFTAKRQGVTDAATLQKMNAEYESSVRDLAAVRDRLRNVYNQGEGQAMRNAGRVAQSMSNINTLADMGGSAISQLSDVTAPIMRYGFMKVFSDGFRPFLKGMMQKDGGAFAEAAQQYKAMGIGVEMALDMKPLAEIGEEFHARTKFERGLNAATSYYMIANLSAPITAKAKSIAAIVIGNDILQAAKALTDGVASAKQIRQLGETSITPELAERIAMQFETGGAVKDGVMLPNTADWTDDSARVAFEGAVSRETNISVVTPGQEKPLWMSNSIGRLLGQFKSFTASATTRILLSNLQRRDAAVLQGIVAQISMGMLGYKIYTAVSGRETSERPQDWVKEGISRSGFMGWLDEGNTLLAKSTGGQADMYKLIGADKPLSRYASRSAPSQLLGPTWGRLENAFSLSAAMSRGEMTQADVHAARRMLPFQNLFYIRFLLDQVEEKSAEQLGIPTRAIN